MKRSALVSISLCLIHLPALAAGEMETFELDPFSVVATRSQLAMSEVPASVSLSVSGDFEHFAMQDAGDLIRFEPLVEIPFDIGGSDAFVPYQSPGYAGYSIRGVGGNRVLLQIDGIRQPSIFSSSGGNRIDLFDPMLLTSLEILKGTGSSLYGSDALGGVVAFSTHGNNLISDNRLQLRTSYDSASNGIAGLAMGSVASDSIGIRLGHVERHHDERENYGGFPENPEDLSSRHTLFSANWQADHNQEIRLTLERFNRRHHLDLNSAESDDMFTEVWLKTEQERLRASLHYTWNPDSHWIDEVTGLIYTQSADTDTQTRQFGNFGGPRDRNDYIDFNQMQFGFEGLATGEIEGQSSHRWTAGISLEASSAENTFIREDPFANPVVDNRIPMAPSDTLRAAIYLQDEWSWNSWRLIAGIRAEHYEITPDNSEDYLNEINAGNLDPLTQIEATDYQLTSYAPSLTLSKRWGDDWMTYIRYSKGYRQPTAAEYTGIFTHGEDFIDLPNPELEEESSDAWELGVKWFARRVTLEAAVFLTDYEGFFQIEETGEVLDPDNPFSLSIRRYQNLEDVRIYGYEILADWWFITSDKGGPTLKLTTTIGQAYGENRLTGEALASISPLKAVAALTWTSANEHLSTTLSATHRARHHDAPTDTVFIPNASTVVELSTGWRVTENLQLNFALKNLFDEKYHLWSNSNQGIHFADEPERSTLPGRNFVLSARLEF